MSRGMPRLCHRVYRNLHIKRKQLILCVLSAFARTFYFTRRHKARKEIVEGFTRRRKARKGEVKGSRKTEYAKNLVGAGLAPALFYFTERGKTLEKVVEFAQRQNKE
jgi:hypothetical protein